MPRKVRRKTKKPKKRNKATPRIKERNLLMTEEQTVLSKERTILSFMRTGLAVVSVGIVVVSILPEISLQIVGWVLIVIGFYEILDSLRRMKLYKKKLDEMKKRHPGAYI